MVIGDEELIAARVAKYFAAGATEVVLLPDRSDHSGEQRRTWEVLGEL